ncbi:hypothetical protein GQ53DRAFT_831983 [Thozetella sp. PMI_491]|nr:hypothetical protein GQ53DRAFT_831983 [Thozetella sp. PMI_491]
MSNQKTNILNSILVELDIQVPAAAKLRTDFPKTAATAKGAGFDAYFQTIYTVHGAFSPRDVDNTSLVVVRIVPFQKHWEKQFLDLTVKIDVRRRKSATSSS